MLKMQVRSFVKLGSEMSGELEKYLRANSDIIRILEIVRELDLKDSWLCAGTIRNFIWNQYHFDDPTDVDVDIVFFDEGISYEKTLEIENHLHYMYPEYKWELKNQIFVHIHSPNSLPYQSSKDAIEKFPESCTMYSCWCTTAKRGKHGTVRPIWNGGYLSI